MQQNELGMSDNGIKYMLAIIARGEKEEALQRIYNSNLPLDAMNRLKAEVVPDGLMEKLEANVNHYRDLCRAEVLGVKK